jgi:OmcA/MtrC family decaheme c-type cytochrome
MRTWRMGAVGGALAAALTIGLASCGDDDNGGAAPIDADRMRLEIQSATLPEAGPATVRFRVLDQSGAPVDLEAEMATTTAVPRTTGPRFTLAMLDDDGDYRSYYEAVRQPAAYTFDGPIPTPAARTQATSPAVTAADLRNVGGGVYEYTFPEPNVTTGMDRSKTHTVAGWISRTLPGNDVDAAGGSFNFVPAGGTAQRDEVVSNAACNRCHGQLTFHGSRRNVQLCITCHSPQSGDPETDRTVDFKVMIHKIHSGETLPSVRQGTPYFIVGNRQTVHDYSEVVFPWHDHGVRHCSVCHTGGEDANNWRTRPSHAACTSCHDNVQFAAAEGLQACSALRPNNFQNCLHTGGPIAVTNTNDVTTCQGCHAQGNAFATDRYHHGG